MCVGLLVSSKASESPVTNNVATVSSVLPVIWMAPFFSGGGYCSEAIDFAKSLSARTEVLIAQHGDSHDHAFVRGLPRDTQALLARLARNGARVTPERAVVVCHSEPGIYSIS